MLMFILGNLQDSMPKLTSTLSQKIRSNPDQPQRVIIRIEGDLRDCERELNSRGFEIRRQFTLIKGFAADAAGRSIQELADADWVTSIEEDQQVHTM